MMTTPAMEASFDDSACQIISTPPSVALGHTLVEQFDEQYLRTALLETKEQFTPEQLMLVAQTLNRIFLDRDHCQDIAVRFTLNHFMGRADMTVEAAEVMLLGFFQKLNWYVDGNKPHNQDSPTMNRTYQILAASLAVEFGSTSAFLGSVWRSLDGYREDFMRTASMIDNPCYPVSVVARSLLEMDRTPAIWLKDWGKANVWHERVADEYSDLGDLPTNLMVDVVASQPVPEAWFVDLFEPVQGLRRKAPGYPGQRDVSVDV